MNGDEAARCIHQINPHMKIIFSTGYDNQSLDGMQNETILRKPCPVKELGSQIRKQLDS